MPGVEGCGASTRGGLSDPRFPFVEKKVFYYCCLGLGWAEKKKFNNWRITYYIR